MDPNPNNFPILSYVMSKMPSFRRAAGIVTDEHDIEQPSSSSEVSSPKEPHFELTEQMPHLKNPEIMAAMRLAVADVASSRKVLKTLGERPDHESVDKAKAKLAEIEAAMSAEMDDIVLSPEKDGGKGKEERGGWKALEREKELCKSVLSLDQMHETSEDMLRGAEERLQKIYDAAVVGSDAEDMEEEKEVEVEEVDEAVVALLKDVEANKKIEKVNLSGRKLRLMPEVFGKIKSLVVLDLSSNQIEVVPDSIAGLENLEELNLSSNLLENLPDSIGLLFKLKILDVSGNKLTALPDSICHCRSLVELNAGFNKLTYLPTNIGYELVNLIRLWIPLNKIRYLPTSIGEMKSLCLLDAHFNELHRIPPSIGKLTKLEILNLSGNFSDLSELPSSIGDLVNLKELELSNNQIRELPDTFGMLQNLSKFNIDQNPLVVPPKEVVNEGVEAIKAYMVRKRLDALLAEEHMSSTHEANDHANASLITRSTSWFSSVISSVTGSVSSYIGGGGETTKDPSLNEAR